MIETNGFWAPTNDVGTSPGAPGSAEDIRLRPREITPGQAEVKDIYSHREHKEHREKHIDFIKDRLKKLDEVEVLVEVDRKIFSDEVKKLNELRGRIKKEIESVLSIGVSVTLVEPKTIERSMGKAKRVVDKRNV